MISSNICDHESTDILNLDEEVWTLLEHVPRICEKYFFSFINKLYEGKWIYIQIMTEKKRHKTEMLQEHNISKYVLQNSVERQCNTLINIEYILTLPL